MLRRVAVVDGTAIALVQIGIKELPHDIAVLTERRVLVNATVGIEGRYKRVDIDGEVRDDDGHCYHNSAMQEVEVVVSLSLSLSILASLRTAYP